MTKLEALEELLAKVEAGIAGYSIFHDCCHILQGFHGRAFEAYNGSLDAAIRAGNSGEDG